MVLRCSSFVLRCALIAALATSSVAVVAFVNAAAAAGGGAVQTITNGPLSKQSVLYDTAGNKVDAHEGHVYFFGDRYYLYGDSYACGFAFDQPASNYCGVKVYDSTDLVHWHPDGLVLDPTGDQDSWDAMCGGATFGCFRPKVAYNALTGLYVMWLNESLGSPGAGYLVLTSPSPVGQFTLSSHVRMSYDRCQQAGKYSFGDEDLFVDDDGTAYLAYTSIDMNCGSTNGLANHVIAIEQLDPTYTKPTGSFTVFSRPYGIEAPSLFKRDGVYYLLFSDPMCAYCSTAGTAYATATSLSKPFTYQASVTPSRLGGQPTGVTPIAANGGTQYLFELDRWQPNAYGGVATNQYEANYFFAPLSFGAGGALLPIPPVVSWQSQIEDTNAPQDSVAATPRSGGLVPLTAPVRLIDTRSALGGVGGRLQPNHAAYTFKVAAGTGLPSDASTLVVNVTAVSATGAGNVTIWGSGPQPSTSVVNYSSTRPTAPNLATVTLGPGRTLHAAVQGAPAFLLVDVQAYATPSSTMTTLAPARRLLDTRRVGGAIPAGASRDVAINSVLPAHAATVTMNLTVVSTGSGNLQAFDPTQPSSGEQVRVVYGAGATANLAMIAVPAAGILRFVNVSKRPINLVLDVQSYDTTAAATLLPNPVRIESAVAPQVGAFSVPFAPGLTYQFDARSAGVPADATAVIAEIGTSPGGSGNLTSMAEATNVPQTSNINFSAGLFQSNLAVIPIRNGMFDTYTVAANTLDISLDVVGYTT